MRLLIWTNPNDGEHLDCPVVFDDVVTGNTKINGHATIRKAEAAQHSGEMRLLPGLKRNAARCLRAPRPMIWARLSLAVDGEWKDDRLVMSVEVTQKGMQFIAEIIWQMRTGFTEERIGYVVPATRFIRPAHVALMVVLRTDSIVTAGTALFCLTIAEGKITVG